MGFEPTKGDVIHAFIQHVFNQQLPPTLSQACSRSQENGGQKNQHGP